MSLPLMPKATAVWLVENTTLSFEQIAEFCGLHPLEVQGIADGELATGILGHDPILAGQITKEELARGEEDPSYCLKLSDTSHPPVAEKKRKGKYTPVARRQDKPDAILWIVKHHPEISDAQIAKLIGTTKNTIASIKDKSHWNMPNIRPRDPVLLGLCTQMDLDTVIVRASGSRKAAAG